MAISASNSKTLSANYGSYTLSVSWSETSTSTANNQSTISATATLSSSNTAFDSGSSAPDYLSHISVYWFDNNACQNGYKIDGTDFQSCGMSPYGSRSASGTVNVTHKSDGTLSGYCRTYFTNNNGGPYAPGSSSCDTSSKSLTTIPRESDPKVSPSTITLKPNSNNRVTVDTNRKASSFTHTVSIDVWNFDETHYNVGTSTYFDIPYSTLGSMPADSLTFTGSTYTQTKSGSTNIGGNLRRTFTIKVDPTIEHPNVGTISIADINPTTSAITQDSSLYIANMSTLQATIPFTVTGDYTALDSATVTCGGETQTYVLSGTTDSINAVFYNVNADSLTVTVRDKRGTTATTTKTWTLLAYQPLTLTASVSRPSPVGDTAVGQISGNAYAGSFGQTVNMMNVTFEFTERGASPANDYTKTYSDIPLSGSSYGPYSNTFPFDFTQESPPYPFDYQKQYGVTVTVSDLFSSATYNCELMQGLPVLSWDETEVDVFGNLHIHDRTDPYKYQDVMKGFDATLAHDGVKNILQMWEGTKTINGVTYTVDRLAGTITLSGTATGYSEYRIAKHKTYNGFKCILSGCPQGGDSRTYFLSIGNYGADYGDGLTFIGNGSVVDVVIGVFSGQTVNGVVFRPMIRDADISSDSYVRYAVTTKPFHMTWSKTYPAQAVSRTDDNFTVHGGGLIWVSASFMQTSNGNYGTIRVGVDVLWLGDSAWIAYTENSDRQISQGSGQNVLRVAASTHFMMNDGDKFRIFYLDTNDGASKILRCQILCLGCYVTKD